jgi:serine/threonine-protein kinase
MFNIHNPFAEVEEVDLPQLVGMEYKSIIRDKNITENFVIELVVTQPKEGYANGIIFEQSPSSVPSLKKGSTIKVKVSSGAQMITLPPFAGQEATSVFAKLKSYDLDYTEVTIDSDTIQEGYVVRTDPEHNTQVPTGSTVTVYVSRGTDKEMLEVPNVGHDREEDAVEMIEEAGFTPVVTYQQSDRYDEGDVIRQSPEGGNLLEEGGEVQLVVSSGEREGSNMLDVLVKLPANITDEVELVAELDGDIVKEVSLIPSDRRVWRVSFEGDGWCTASIYLDGMLLCEYELDFDDKTVDQVEDNLNDFEDW